MILYLIMKARDIGPLVGFSPVHTRDIYLIVSLPLIIAFALLTLGLSSALYRGRIKEANLGESRYLTVEWRLLQTLKAKTDVALREKDNEIASLSRRYQALRLRGSPEDVLSQLEAELRKAEEERADILASRFQASSLPQLAKEGPLDTRPAVSSAAPVAMAELLRQRISLLEASLDDMSQRAEKAEAELAFARKNAVALATAAVPPQAPGAVPPEAPAAVLPEAPARAEMPVSGSSAQEVLGKAIAALESKRQALGTETSPGLEDIKTRALVRAILHSSEIRAKYPSLMEAFDHYLEVYGKQQLFRGRVDAYGGALETLQSVAGG